MEDDSSTLTADLMTMIAMIFILIALVFSSLITLKKQVIRPVDSVKTNQSTDQYAPKVEEMANVYFVFDGQQPVIQYQAEGRTITLLANFRELKQKIEMDAPSALAVNVDKGYPYDDVGRLLLDFSSASTQVYMVAEHEN